MAIKDLAVSEEFAQNLPTITPKKLAKISERMVEIDRANNTAGKRNTQTTTQLMTLTMLTDSPYRRLRQILAQIESKRSAVEASYWKRRKTELLMQTWAEKGDAMSMLKLEQIQHGWERGKMYIDGSLREIGALQDAYEEIKKNNNIPDEWDEEDAEIDEIRHHIRQAFRQSHRDMILNGSISQGNAEYLEQYGIHLQTARNFIAAYIAGVEKMINEDGKMPNIDHLYEFLDNCVEVFGEEYIKVMNHIGITELVRSEWLFKNSVNK